MVGKTSVNFGFTHDCTKLFKSGAYLYTIKVKNMSSRDPKVGNNTKERFIYFNLMKWKDASETGTSKGGIFPLESPKECILS